MATPSTNPYPNYPYPSEFNVSDYPYPSEFNVSDLVPDKLSKSNYSEWKPLMLDFIESQGMDRFIHHPPEDSKLPDYYLPTRSDRLVRRWILSTLSKDIIKQVLPYKTAREVWMALEKMLGSRNAQPPDWPSYKEIDERLGNYMPLHINAIQGDIQSAMRIINNKPEAITMPISTEGETMLITAVRSVRRNKLVAYLLAKLPPEDLAQGDNLGRTALHEAAEVGNLEAAKMLVEQNPNLPYILDKNGQTPLLYAAKTGNREMVRFLLDWAWAGAGAGAGAGDRAERGFEETEPVPPTLLYHLANSGLYDIALKLLQQNNKLVDPDTSMLTGTETYPLMAMSQKRSSFRSGTPLNSFQKFIYSMTGRWHARQWHLADQFVPPIKHIRETKLKHDEALELVKGLCQEIAKLNFSKASWMFTQALAQATSSGIHEIVEEILRSYPAAIYFKNENNQSIFQSAIVWRRENVFNLIYQLKECSRKFLSVPDRFGNNALHLAGCLGPQQHLSVRVSAAGAALQMQRELQWFKEVEKFVLPQDKECRNHDGMTPAEVFTKTHKELVEAGERWMKDTATSCTIVAALIATMTFPAAITVPGGNNASGGVSMFSKQKAFVIFSLSDALALFTSIASLLMFLSILTTRYAEEDFLYSLPNSLIRGLGYLFLSISSTMTAFGATLYLMMGENRPWIIYPIVAFAYIPVHLFGSLLFPLLVVMYKSTYHPAIFGKPSDHMLF